MERVMDEPQDAPKRMSPQLAYYYRNREQFLAAQKARKQANPEKTLAAQRVYQKANRSRISKHQAAKYLGEREERRIKAAAYYLANREKIRAKQAVRNATRERSERERLTNKIRTAICNTLKKLGERKARRSWTSLVGYTIEELVTRLKRTMPPGYTWQDYLDGRLHLDHIVPIAAFNYRSSADYDFKRCWALKNLQLLPALENLKKHTKLTTPFQPSLL
jgi:hypothetical protein